MAQDKNTQRSDNAKQDNSQRGRSGRIPGGAPRTSETAGANKGGQTERVTDKPKREKQSGGR